MILLGAAFRLPFFTHDTERRLFNMPSTIHFGSGWSEV